MAYQSAFRERLADMEATRNNRLSLLQAEKDLQKQKSEQLSAKLTYIRSLEQRCLLLDNKLAAQNFKVSSSKSEIDFLERKYLSFAQLLRELKVEVDELESEAEEKERSYYSVKCSEMAEFNDRAKNFAEEIRGRVEDLRRCRDVLKLSSLEFQKNGREVQNPDIQSAEIRRLELLAKKDKVARSLESNNQVKAELEKQVQSLT